MLFLYSSIQCFLQSDLKKASSQQPFQQAVDTQLTNTFSLVHFGEIVFDSAWISSASGRSLLRCVTCVYIDMSRK